MKNFLAKLIHFWDEDRSLTVMLLLLVSFIFVLVPCLNPGRAGELIIRVIYSVMLLTAVFSVARKRRYLFGVVSVFALISLIVNWVSDVEPSRSLSIAHDFSAIFFNLFFAIAILAKTFQQGEITYHRIEGSIVVFLLIGLIFAYIFHVIYLFEGASSFNNISGVNLKEFLYYSFTTLTTMGYGDITPVHPLARSLANFESLFGQLYPAILIARLVSMEFEASLRKRKS